MLSFSPAAYLCKIRHANKISILQDFDDDVTHSLPDATATVELPSEASKSPATPSQETALEEPTGEDSAGRYIVVGLILLTIGTTMFVLLGGLGWLRRLAAGHRSRYRKLNSEDPEK